MKLTAAFMMMACMIASGLYLIIQTESHLEEASTVCDSTASEGSEDDPMQPWRFGSCFKGKVYPFVPIEDYNSPNGEKLYCDCKYSIIPEYVNLASAVGFVNKMKSP